MNITGAQFTAMGNITALVDGVQVTIPTDAENRHYAALIEQNIKPAPYVAPGLAAAVKAECDRRLVADFEFNGVMFQRDPTSLQRITGAATLAGFAIAAGVRPGNLRWANPDRDFAWIASDNSLVEMDAQTAFAFGQAAAAVETRIIYAAKALREMDPIPDDYDDDRWWR